MPKSSLVVLLAMVAVWPLVACATEKPPVKTGVSGPTRIPNPVAADAGPTGVAVPTASMPREVRRAVVTDAARRFKVAENAVVLAQAEKVTWSDGALGCPEPAMAYTQVMVEGFRVVAKTAAGTLGYNTDNHGRVVSCGPAGLKSGIPVMDTEPKPYPPSQPEK